MPELNLSQAQALRIANQDALAVRIANVDVWTAPDPFVIFNVFGDDPPTSSHFPSYATGSDLGTGGWTANAFYSYGNKYEGALISGVRLWVPSGSILVGESVKIGLFQTPEGNEVSWVGYQPGDIIEGISTGEAVKTFPSGTLVAGWNNLYFDATWPLIHHAYFAVGVSIGDGSKYLFGAEETGDPFRARSGAHIALSEDHSGLHRGIYRIGTNSAADSSWTSGHYGLDVIIRVPITTTLYDHSIWLDTVDTGRVYHSYTGLGTGGWTTSHFYSAGSPSQDGWQLAGARLWVPLAENDTAGVIGQTAQCGYYIKTSGAINNAEDTPVAIINAVKANTLAPIQLESGWNNVYLPEPIEFPWGAGIAIGWTIGDGNAYISEGLFSNSVRALDESPFWLAASGDGDEERRGAFTENGIANWSFATNHYGGDIIVREANK